MHPKREYKYDNTPSVQERWPKLTLMELAEGQNKINGSILATTHHLYGALEEVINRLEALEAAIPKDAASQKKRAEVASVDQAMNGAGKYITGIGGKQPPGCSLPGGFVP